MARDLPLANQFLEATTRKSQTRRRIPQIRRHLGRPQTHLPAPATGQPNVQLLRPTTRPATRQNLPALPSHNDRRNPPPHDGQPAKLHRYVWHGLPQMRPPHAPMRRLYLVARISRSHVPGRHRCGRGGAGGPARWWRWW